VLQGAQIFWEGALVTTANKNNGGFSFLGILPNDCIETLSDGEAPLDVAVLGCTPPPVSQGGWVLKTGQTTCYGVVGEVITCTGTGQDGEFQAGTPVPNPRFTDNANGTVTDNLTGLTWLKNASCLGVNVWVNALAAANALAHGNVACGLTDGSVAGDWRLPNRNELTSLLDLETSSRAPLPASHPFINFVAFFYWSSTTNAAGDPFSAWSVLFNYAP
jgi:uncharacterized protein DUF1566